MCFAPVSVVMKNLIIEDRHLGFGKGGAQNGDASGETFDGADSLGEGPPR